MARLLLLPDPTFDGFDALRRFVQGQIFGRTQDRDGLHLRWSLGDIRSFVKGMHFSLERLLPDMVQYDAWAQGMRFELPIFVFHGERDVVTSTAQAQAFFAAIEAPLKYMDLISNAGHFAAFLEPEQFLQKLLEHVRPLASVPQFADRDSVTANAVSTATP